MENNQQNSFLSLFVPKQGYFVTPIVIIACLLIFGLMVLNGVGVIDPSGQDLIYWGANFGPLTLQGEYWRALTCIFLHIGILHLLFNMYVLMQIGVMLEEAIGSVLFAGAYLVTGLFASMTSLWWHSDLISAGASGAIFGMYGVYIALALTDLVDKASRKQLLTNMAMFVGFNLMYGMQAGIDNAAHIGGLLSGFVLGFAIYPALSPRWVNKAPKGLPLVAMGLLLALGIGMAGNSRISYTYSSVMTRFSELENKAIGVYGEMEESFTEANHASRLRNETLPIWNKCFETLQQLDSIRSADDEEVKEVKGMLEAYCKLRIKHDETWLADLEDGTLDNTEALLDIRTEITQILGQLNAKVEGDEAVEETPAPEEPSSSREPIPKDVLYIVDGEKRENVDDLDPSNIESVEVLKGKEAAAAYGEEGKSGVIIIVTKTAE